MTFYILTFLLGDILLQRLHQLPQQIFFIILFLATLIVTFIFRKQIKYIGLITACLAGFCWTGWYANHVLSWQLPKELEGKPIVITGVIASIPVKDQWQTNFDFVMHTLQDQQKIFRFKTKIRLSWKLSETQMIQSGQEWRLQVRLKRIHALQNPHTFDFEAWSLQQQLRARGTVLENANHQLLAHHWYQFPLLQWRENLQKNIQFALPQSSTALWLNTLIIGEHHGVPTEYWNVLRKTGTNHLMAIAGLHIGMCASLIYFITHWCWRRFEKLMLMMPAQTISCYTSTIAAWLYSALAGFSLPTQRACFMLTIFMLARITHRTTNAWHVWSVALLFVLIVNPLHVLSESFWLSFLTIAIIIFGMSGRIKINHWWWKFGRAQWVIAVGLIPLSILFFQEVSLIGLIANTIAIPWLEFFILPFCLLAAICASLSRHMTHVCLSIADFFLSYLWWVLTTLSTFSWSFIGLYKYGVNLFIVLTIFSGILLFPAGFPKKTLLFILSLVLLSDTPNRPRSGEIWLTVLDVGQGLSVVVKTKHHLLVYDAGPKINLFNAGEQIVIPYLRTFNTKKIDMLVVSHGDNDHIGGAYSIMQTFHVKRMKTSVPEKFFNASYCLQHQHWQWDGVQFSFLYPSENDLHLNNNSSCVLKIENQNNRILLTGDIEKLAEKKLLEKNRNGLSATVLIAPHHGSKTSDDEYFIRAINPKIVVFATGYRNRYHFPHVRVIQKYQQLNIQQFNTVNTGALFFKFAKNHSTVMVDDYRQTHAHYWYDH